MNRTERARCLSLIIAAMALSGCALCKRTDPAPASTTPNATTAAPLASVASAPTRAPAGPLWSKSTYGVVAGVLSFESPSLAPFSTRNRKDRELYETLAGRGVPRGNMALLLDRDVTAAAVRASVTSQAKRAGPGSTFLFYYAGHGMRDGDGEPFFAAYDTGTDPSSTAISLRELADVLATHFRGTRVVLMADCCYSGTLREVARELADHGLEVISLTSADASNLSTSNWTFTQAIIDALGGDPLMDRDRDGTITLGEVDREVGDAMKYREKQRHGFFLHAVPAQLAWASAKASGVEPGAGPFSRGKYVEARIEGRWLPVRIVRTGGEYAVVRLYDYADSEDRRVGTPSLRVMRFDHHPVGAQIQVLWGGKIWPARVTDRVGDFHRITYPGWPPYWDEWVLSNRIVSGKVKPPLEAGGERVEVEWNGRWYPALVLQRSGDRALIHYEGYDDTWDEWVGPERMRAR